MQVPYTLRLEFQNWRPRKRKPISVTFTQFEKPTREATGYTVLPHQWDPVAEQVINHPSAVSINKAIYARLDAYIKKAAALEVAEMPVTRDIIRKPAKIAFETFAKAVRGDNRSTVKEINRIVRWLGREPKLGEINLEWLRLYREKMEEDHEDWDLAPETIFCTFKFLRRICNVATAEGKMISNPFKDPTFKMPPEGVSNPTFLEEHEIDELFKIIDAFPQNDRSQEYADLVYFTIACFVGFRHSDWHKISPDNPPYFVGEDCFLQFRAKKNDKSVVVYVGGKVLRLYERIKGIKPSEFSGDASVNIRKLVGDRIKKHITTHVARHSFGYKAASRGWASHMLCEILGIGETAVKVYFHLTGKNITKQTNDMKYW